MFVQRTAASLSIAAFAGFALAIDTPDNIPGYIGDGLVAHYPFDNLGDGFMTDPGNPVGGTFPNSEAINFGRGGEFGLNLAATGDLNSDFILEGPMRSTGKLGFGVSLSGDDRLDGGTDNNAELGLEGGYARTVSFWALPSVDELKENELIDPGPDFIFGTDDDVLGDDSCFVDIGRLFGSDTDGRGFTIELDNNDDLEVGVGGTRTNGFGGTRPVDMTQRAKDGVWTLVTVVVPDVTAPGIVDKGDAGPSVHDIIIYADGMVWDTGDTGNNDRLIETDYFKVYVGERSSGGAAQRYDGGIDDLAIWNIGLSQAEISVMFELANSALQYNAGQFDLLRQVHNGDIASARINGLEWTRAEGLSGSGVQGVPPNATVVFDHVAGTGVVSSVAQDGLLVHYSFDLGADGDAILMNEGLTGAQNDGVNLKVNNPEAYLFSAGVLGQAVDGVDPNNTGINQNNNSHVTQGGLSPITGGEERTVSVWARSTANEFDTLLTLGTNSPVRGTKWDLNFPNNAGAGTVSMGFGNGNIDQDTYTGPDIRDGEWHLITTTLPAGGTTVGDVRVFVDGDLANVDPALTQTVQTGPSAGWLYLMRGANHNGVGGGATVGPNRYTGALDDVAIWNIGFSDDFIKGLFDVASIQYNARDFDTLRQAFEAMGSATVGGLEWTYATGLPNAAGLTGSDPSYTLVLDAAAGTGLTSSVPGPQPCNVADLALPFGVLDLGDIDVFIAAFLVGGAAADIAPPMGIVDLGDIDAFIAAFLGGCP